MSPLARRTAAVLAGTTAALALSLAPAGADTRTDTFPATPATNPKLPIIHTTHGSAGLKPNVLNPHPVCNAWEDYRTVIYTVKDKFSPVGTISTHNSTNGPIPLTQTLSKTQSIELKLSGDIGGEFSGVKASIQPSIAYSLSWTAGQEVGPYQVAPGATASATYGFHTVSFEGTQQRCLINGTWSNPWTLRGEAPVENAVEVKTYTDPVDATHK